MKKLVIFLFACVYLCCVSCYDDSELIRRIDTLEKTTIASISQQIDAIKSSLLLLQGVDKELKESIQKLELKDEYLQDNIDILKDANKALNAKIDNLSKYLEEELKSSKNWMEATFATLMQYDSLATTLVAIQVDIDALEEEFKIAIDKALETSQQSMRIWINEQLSGYWSIAETEAKLESLKESNDIEIDAIKKELNKTAEDLTEAYKEAINEAISESQGKISSKIKEVNAALEDKIMKIELRLTAIEEKIAIITREFAIGFDDYDIGILPGGTTSVGYTIKGSTDKTIVKAFGQNGWSAKVISSGKDKGKITVTAPNPITDEEIIVLVYDGEYRTIMSSVNFVTGVVIPSQTVVEVEADAGTVDISITSNLNYNIVIPEESKDWISVVETKAIRKEIITFAYAANEGILRKSVVSLVDNQNNAIDSITIVQQGAAVQISTVNGGELSSLVGLDNISFIKGLVVYGPINGTDFKYIRKMINLQTLDLTNAKIVSGGEVYYSSSWGNHKTIDDVVGQSMFENLNIEVVHLPKDVYMVQNEAFYGCRKLKEVCFGDKLEVIGDNAFKECISLKKIILPNSLYDIGNSAFYHDTELKDVVMSKNIKYIEAYAFSGCNSLESIIIPSQVEFIGQNAFSNCLSLMEIHIQALPTTLTYIGPNLFDNIYKQATLYIPKGTKDYYYTDLGRFSNIVEE